MNKVEKLENDIFEVEFCDKNGITLASIALESQYLYYCGTGLQNYNGPVTTHN